MREVRIENWSITARPGNPYQAPELWEACLYGIVYGHPNFPDDTAVTTSPIQEVDGRKITTRNTIYTLGEVNPVYKEYCAKEGSKADLDGDNPLELFNTQE